MAGKIGFWTQERLKELGRLSRSMSTMELAKHFDREAQAILDALAFFHQDKKLRVSRTTKRRVTVTIYKPGYARGAIPVQDDESDDD